jgi:hypothetical protein
MAMWQQQMRLMESFHNDMIMMVQMFFAMHREHMASAREELDKVEQLTRELSDLQARLREPIESPESSSASAVGRSSKPVPSNSSEERQKRFVTGQSTPETHGRESRTVKSRPKSSKGKPLPRRDEARELDSAQLHAQLTKRITELQRERQGYWQSIMSKMSK